MSLFIFVNVLIPVYVCWVGRVEGLTFEETVIAMASKRTSQSTESADATEKKKKQVRVWVDGW